TTIPDSAGNWTAIVTGLAIGDSVTATTIDSLSNTSEFCPCVGVAQAPQAGVGDAKSRCGDARLTVVGANPSRSGTAVRYSIQESGHVRLRVYAVTGELVSTLVDRVEQTGFRNAEWDGRNLRGRPVASGVYVVRLETGNTSRQAKVVIMR
ncbi:MAG: T9SS type A sorting domain-containing protein, partial [bacterium]